MNLTQIIKKFHEIDFCFIVTGANGWFGKYILEILHNNLAEEFTERVFAISNSTKEIKLQKGLIVKCIDYSTLLQKNKKYIILHFAFLTQDAMLTNSEADFIKINLEIRSLITNIINTNNVNKMLYISSGAVYNESNLYGRLKKEDEKYFIDLTLSRNCEIIIPRVFNVAGPYINKYNAYALSNFICQAIENKKITINSKSLTYRNYVHISNIFEVCLAWLLDKNKPEKSLIFDASTKDSIELGVLAEEIAKISQDNIKISRELDVTMEKQCYAGDSKQFTLLATQYKVAIHDLQTMLKETFNFIHDHK